MAKDTDLADDDKVEQMSAESKDFLEQVRKGKARNFVMSVKGNKVRNLLVKKKKIKDAEKREMRGQGFQPVFGVASGMGVNVTFTIARSDGFEDAPGGGKVDKLKKFLNEQTGKTFKPAWEVVDTPPALPFDEDDLQHPLIARSMKLEPVITKALDAHPGRAGEIQQKVAEIRELLQDDGTIAKAGPSIDALVTWLKELLASAEEAQAPAGDDSTPKLAEALRKLKPLVNKVVNAQPGRQNELHGTMAKIAGEIKAKQFDLARQNITQFAALLKSLVGQQPSAAAEENVDRMTEFAQRRDVIEPKLIEAQQKDRERATKLGAVWNYANEQAQAGNFDNAFNALTRLAQAIKDVLSSAPGGTESMGIEAGIVEKRKYLVTRFKELEPEIRPQLVAVKLRVTEDGADDDPEELADAIEAGLHALYGELQDEIDKAVNAGDSNVVAGLKDRVRSHELVQHLLDNPFTDGTRFQQAILDALDEVEQTLAV